MADLIIDRHTEQRFQNKFSQEELDKLFGSKEPTLEQKSLAVRELLRAQKGIESKGPIEEPIFGGLFGGQKEYEKARKLEEEQKQHLDLFEEIRTKEMLSHVLNEISAQQAKAEREALIGKTVGDLPLNQRIRLEEQGLLDFGEILGPPKAPILTAQDTASSESQALINALGLQGQNIDEVLGVSNIPEQPQDLGLTPVLRPSNTPLTEQQSSIAFADLKTQLSTQRSLIPEGQTKVQAQKQFALDLEKSNADIRRVNAEINDLARAGETAKEKLAVAEQRLALAEQKQDLTQSNQLLGMSKAILELQGLEGEELGNKLNELMELVLPRSIRLDPRQRGFWERLFTNLAASDVEATVKKGPITPDESSELE